VGVYGESFISDALSIQPNYYSQQGYEITNSSGTFTQKINYINLPLMLKAYPSQIFSRSWTTNRISNCVIKKNIAACLVALKE
jgi:hypothetical protein